MNVRASKWITTSACIAVLFLCCIGTDGYAQANNENAQVDPAKTFKDRTIKMRRGVVDPSKVENRLGRARLDYDGRKHMLVQFESLPSNIEKEEARNRGIELLSYVPNKAYWVAVDDAGDPAKIRAGGGIRYAWVPDAVHKISPLIDEDVFPPNARHHGGLVTVNVKLFDDIDASTFITTLSKQAPYINSINLLDLNLLEIRLPKSRITDLAGVDEVHWIEPGSGEIVSFNQTAARRVRADILAGPPLALDGSGSIVGVWERGTVDSHADFDNRLSVVETGLDDADDDHATHVAGTIAGSGTGSATARGMAPEALIRSWNTDNDASEMRSGRLNDGIVISNHSYGFVTGWRRDPDSGDWVDHGDSGFGLYNSSAAAYDDIVYDTDLLVFKAAGNDRDDGPDCFTGGPRCDGDYESIGFRGNAKNIVSVCALTDADGMTPFSSWGPTDDGRIKPDLCANGFSLWSTLPNGGYGVSSGTSMASPSAAGTAALLFQHYVDTHGVEPSPALLKALMIHGARDLGNIGPDYQYGWGLIDAVASADLITEGDTGTGSLDYTDQPNALFLPVTQDDLKVTLVWTDPQGDPSVQMALVNDLDLVLTAPDGTEYAPWVLDPDNPDTAATKGRNAVDNVEQVVVNNPKSGLWIVSVEGQVPMGPQDFALVVPGLLPQLNAPTILFPAQSDQLARGIPVHLRWDNGYSDSWRSILYQLYLEIPCKPENPEDPYLGDDSKIGESWGTESFEWTPLAPPGTDYCLRIEASSKGYQESEVVSAPFALFDGDIDSDGLIDTVDPDADGDGIPNRVEVANGLDFTSADDASLDNDHDGWNNLEEFRFGTGIEDSSSNPGTISSYAHQLVFAADGAEDDVFGTSVAIDDNTALISAPGDEVNGSPGSVYVFTKENDLWIEQQKLLNPNFSSNSAFGSSVALSGNTAVIGANGVDAAAYIFLRTGSNWTLQQTLLPADGGGEGFFGVSVSIDGDTTLIGASRDGANGEAAGAAYVFIRNSGVWTEQQKLIAPDGAAWDVFGSSVSLAGDTALIGAVGDDDNGDSSGSAYVYTRIGAAWSQQQKLTASDGANGDDFGGSVSLSGDTALVGASKNDHLGADKGAAYVYVRSSGLWSQQQKLTALDGYTSDRFGYSVALDGDTAVVSAIWDDDSGQDAGSAYAFVRDSGVWSAQEKLLSQDGKYEDTFGIGVSVSGSMALIGASWDDEAGITSGAAYFFEFSDIDGDGISDQEDADIDGDGIPNNVETLIGLDPEDNVDGLLDLDYDNWSNVDEYRFGTMIDEFQSSPSFANGYPHQKVFGSDEEAEDYFGSSVSLFGDTALVGAPSDENNRGGVYVFNRQNGVWRERQKLVGSDSSGTDYFGSSLSLSGDTAVISATGGASAAYVFVRSNGVWTEQQKLTTSAGATGDQFGSSVSLSGDTVVIGAQWDEDNGDNAGAAYVFVRSNGVWTEQEKLSASDGAPNDSFGSAVSLSGDTVLIGADGDDDTGTSSGSAYVYTRSNGSWTEQQKLTASDAAAGDYFGASVSLSDDTALIGAYRDDDNGISSGSAYIYGRSNGTWAEEQKLTPSDSATGDWFGFSVAITGSTALISAYKDDADEYDSGSAYLYILSGGVWVEHEKLIANDGEIYGRFGGQVSLSQGATLIGAIFDGDNGSDSGAAYFSAFAVPDAPTIISTSVNETSVQVQFSANGQGSTLITGYSATCGGLSMSGQSSPITVEGLVSDTDYSCTVSAQNAIGASAPSLSASVRTLEPPPQPPQPPTINSIEPQDGGLLIHFSITDEGDFPVTEYTVTCGGVSQSGGQSPIIVQGLYNEQEYSCTVLATSVAGNSSPSAPGSGMPEEASIFRSNILLIIEAVQAANEGG